MYAARKAMTKIQHTNWNSAEQCPWKIQIKVEFLKANIGFTKREKATQKQLVFSVMNWSNFLGYISRGLISQNILVVPRPPSIAILLQ